MFVWPKMRYQRTREMCVFLPLYKGKGYMLNSLSNVSCFDVVINSTVQWPGTEMCGDDSAYKILLCQ